MFILVLLLSFLLYIKKCFEKKKKNINLTLLINIELTRNVIYNNNTVYIYLFFIFF